MIEGQHHHSQGVAWALVAVEEVEHTRAGSQRADWPVPYLSLDCASNESRHDGSVGAANTRLAQAFEGLKGARSFIPPSGAYSLSTCVVFCLSGGISDLRMGQDYWNVSD